MFQQAGQKERARVVVMSVSLILIGWRPFWMDENGFTAALLDFDLEKIKYILVWLGF